MENRKKKLTTAQSDIGIETEQPQELEVQAGNLNGKEVVIPKEIFVEYGDLSPVRMSNPVEEMKAMINRQHEVRQLREQFIKDSLVEGSDYGVIEMETRDGRKYKSKPTLFKPGAEKLMEMGMLTARFEIDKDLAQFSDKEGVIFYKCILSKPDGIFVAEGGGACAVTESRIKGNWNSAVKMARKRAQTDAVLRAFALSDIFTQDLEDMDTTPSVNHEKTYEPNQSNNSSQKKNNAPNAGIDDFDPTITIIKGGKHAGKKWADLPESYLKWCLENAEGNWKDMAYKTLVTIYAWESVENAKQRAASVNEEASNKAVLDKAEATAVEFPDPQEVDEDLLF